jgi:hypothetical protein
MPNPWVSLRRDQLIPVKQGSERAGTVGKGLEEMEGKKLTLMIQNSALPQLKSQPG